MGRGGAGRVLLSRPAVVVLDEATSAVDVASEAALYAAVSDAGITALSVGHRPSLVSPPTPPSGPHHCHHRHCRHLPGPPPRLPLA